MQDMDVAASVRPSKSPDFAIDSMKPCQIALGRSADAAVALLTGGNDKPYVLGLAPSLTARGLVIDIIGSDDLSVPELKTNEQINFINLRGNQRSDASICAKALRIARYYFRLIRYTAGESPRLLHILWNNKFEIFDRTFLMLYYALLGKRIALTAHNVNARKRDQSDSWINRISLRIQYGLSDHIFVHSHVMKQELSADFGVCESKVSVIPFGINNTVPNTSLSREEAREQIGIRSRDKVLLFFGQIAPYKGLDFLTSAFVELLKRDSNYRLVIAGRPKWDESYWHEIEESLVQSGVRERVVERIHYIPDDETETYFKAADVLVLPYRHIFQSGVLFLSYSFGLPVVASDVGSLREDIVEGETGFVCKPQDVADLADAIARYFASELYRDLAKRRAAIKAYANERYSWAEVAAITTGVYSKLLSI
jgi:D-inositol-3-phosphate glycosyltransferase